MSLATTSNTGFPYACVATVRSGVSTSLIYRTAHCWHRLKKHTRICCYCGQTDATAQTTSSDAHGPYAPGGRA